MKRNLFLIIITVVCIMILPSTVLPQAKQKTMQIDQKQMQVMQMMRDSSSVNMLMDRMASDSAMRAKLMDKMINRVKDDSTGMMLICRKIKDNKEMHSTMLKVMEQK